MIVGVGESVWCVYGCVCECVCERACVSGREASNDCGSG